MYGPMGLHRGSLISLEECPQGSAILHGESQRVSDAPHGAYAGAYMCVPHTL